MRLAVAAAVEQSCVVKQCAVAFGNIVHAFDQICQLACEEFVPLALGFCAARFPGAVCQTVHAVFHTQQLRELAGNRNRTVHAADLVGSETG